METDKKKNKNTIGEFIITSADIPGIQPIPEVNRWIWIFIALGIVARAVRYFSMFPLWEDECFLGVNLFKRGYAGLLEPLQYHQVAPVLFLWLEKTVVHLLGFNELSLRLLPFIFGILSLVLFCHLTSRILSGTARLLCIALFAVSYPCIRYTAEAKNYGFDLFASLVLIVLAVEWLYSPERKKWLWGLILFAPLAVGLSYPAVFTGGGISIIILTMLMRKDIRGAWWPWLLFNVILVGSFALTYLLCAGNQMSEDLDFQRAAYTAGLQAFPPLDSAVTFLKWFILSNTGSLFAHPVGSVKGGSTLSFVLFIVGMIYFFRKKKSVVAVLALGPLAIHFCAALLRFYPYAGHVKFSMYIAPMIYLMIGAGIFALLVTNKQKIKPEKLKRNIHIILAILALIGVGTIVRDVVKPYKCRSDMRARAFAQWFWYNANFEGRAVCIKDDLNRDFSTKTFHSLSWSAMYLCNKYIYKPKTVAGIPIEQWIKEHGQQVLRCVLYRDPWYDFDQKALDQWLAEMQTEYEYVGKEVYPFPRLNQRENRLKKTDYIEIYKFVPKQVES